MKYKKGTCIKCAILITFILFTSLSLFAYDNSMYVESLNINVDVEEDNQYVVSESYRFNYLSEHHGFYREIPTNYQASGYYAILKDITSDNPYSIDASEYSTNLIVGDANKYVKGLKDYKIGFTLDVGKNYSEEEDGKTYFYYNLVGQYWDFPINNISFSINFPEPIEANNISFTSGSVGSTDNSVTYTLSPDRKSISGTIESIMPSEALTLYVDLPENYFSGERDYIAKTDRNFIFSLLIAALIIVVGIVTFIRYGRDEDIIEVQSFTPPEGFNPMKLSYFLTKSVSVKDTTAMLFYWADKGYISIKENDESKKEYSIIKLKELSKSCDLAERKLFDAYFENAQINEEVRLDEFGKSFVEKRDKAIDRLGEAFNIKDSTELVNRDAKKAKNGLGLMAALAFLIIGYFTPVSISNNPLAATFIPFGLNIFFLVFLNVVLSKLINNSVTSKKTSKFALVITSIATILFFSVFNLVFIGLGSFENTGYKFALLNIASVVIIALLLSLSEKRSDYATKTYGTILGYKSFIEFVEIDKLKLMIAEDPDLFYHTLCYAIVFGLEKKWYKKFETIDIRPNNNFIFLGYSGVYLASSFNNMSSGINHSVNQSIGSVKSSSSSGGSFSGGSAGGGFGGGGGGGW
jgi:uncharacterized membrane protein YgcG